MAANRVDDHDDDVFYAAEIVGCAEVECFEMKSRRALPFVKNGIGMSYYILKRVPG